MFADFANQPNENAGCGSVSAAFAYLASTKTTDTKKTKTTKTV